MKQKRLLFAAAIVFLMLVVGSYVLYPQVRMISGSLHMNGRLSFERYRQLLDVGNRANVEAVMNSVGVSLLSVAGAALLGGLLAFTVTQFRFRFRSTMSKLAMLPLGLPPLVGVIAFLFVFGEGGMLPRLVQRALALNRVPFYLDGFAAVVAVHSYSFYVYFYLFIADALRTLDGSLVEAASSLGSSRWNTMTRVVLPALRPAVVGASVLTFMASMASFSAPLIFGGGRRFLTTEIYATKLNGELDLAAAQSVLLTVVSIVFFVVLNMTRRTAPWLKAVKGTSRPSLIQVGAGVRKTLIGLASVMLVILILPIVAIIVISFVKEGSWTWQVLPTVFTGENYIKLLSDPRVFEPIGNSLIMSALAVAGSAVVGVIAAFVLVKGGTRKWTGAVDVLLNLSFAIPGTVIAMGLIYAFNAPSFASGYMVLVGTFWIVPLAYFTRMYPFVVRSTSSALEQLDDTLMEAGESLGAGMVRRFAKITLPLIAPGIVSGCVLVAIGSLGEFVSSILLYSYSNRPVSVEILSLLRGYNFGASAAYCVVLLAIILALTVLANRGMRTGGLRMESHF